MATTRNYFYTTSHSTTSDAGSVVNLQGHFNDGATSPGAGRPASVAWFLAVDNPEAPTFFP